MKKIIVSYPHGPNRPATASVEGEVGIASDYDVDKAIGLLVKALQEQLGIVIEFSQEK